MTLRVLRGSLVFTVPTINLARSRRPDHRGLGHPHGALGHAGPAITGLLIGSGPLTAIALFLFAYGARLLPYSTVGVLQYIAPTLQLACGVFAFHEQFERTRAIGFALIWAALLIYAGESLWLSRKRQRAFA